MTISKEVLGFLRDLRENNNRDWFNDRKPKFKQLEAEVKDFGLEVTNLLNQHDKIEKTKQFRIYRDIRFSKDKTPYKRHFGIHFRRHKPGLRGGYYLHIEPDGKSFIDVGFWNPSREDLERVRKEWEIDADEVREILTLPGLRKSWGKMHGDQLKTAPRGYDRDHPDIDLLNYKQWLFQHPFTDEEVMAEDFAAVVNEHFKQIRPFFDYMSDVLTTDLNGVSLI